MRNSIYKIEEFIKDYPITDACSVAELNRFSQELQNEILKEGVSFS